MSNTSFALSPQRASDVFRFRRQHHGPLPQVRCRPTTTPVLPVVDMAEAIGFYELLGFGVTPYDPGYAWVTHCGFEWFHLRLLDDVTNNHASGYFHVDDAEQWHQGMREASSGAIELGEIADTPWGKREFTVKDPAGNQLRFGSPTKS